MQLSSLTWTLVFQTRQKRRCRIHRRAISKPELRNAQDFASIHIHSRVRERDSWFSKFCDTIVETVHCWPGQRIVLPLVYRLLSFHLIDLRIRAYIYLYIEDLGQFSSFFFQSCGRIRGIIERIWLIVNVYSWENYNGNCNTII